MVKKLLNEAQETQNIKLADWLAGRVSYNMYIYAKIFSIRHNQTMLRKNKQKQKKPGFTMIEALVGVFLMAVLSVGIYSTYAFGLKVSIHNRLRTEATAIAEKKIEAIRAMKYEDIGVQGGIPPGLLIASENEIDDGTNFSVKTSVRYIDDPLDGKAPIDPAPADYKQIEIKVNWPTNMEDKSIILDTLVAPPRIETKMGAGVLMINIVDSQGNPLANCNVHVKNSTLNPPIDLNEETDASGSLSLPGAPSSSKGYSITILKDNYETAQTYPPYPTSSFNPLDPDIAVAEGETTSKTFIIDPVAHQNFHFFDVRGNNLSNLTFSLVGGKVIGTTVEAAPKNVYIYNEPALVTDANGKWASPAIGKGPYSFSINNPNYELVTTNLYSPWSVAPSSNIQAEIVMGAKTDNVLVVSVKETSGDTAIVGATVKITDSTGALFQQATSDINGIAYLPQIENPVKNFTPGETYTIEASKDGYLTNSQTTNVSGVTRKQITLTKQ